MRALLKLAPLKPTEDRLTGSVVLALMNWMSKGDRATAPFSQELSKSGCVNGALGENHKLVGKHFGSRTAEVCSRTQVSIPSSRSLN